MTSLFHDDITWCNETDCPMTGCCRNVVNIRDRAGIHSYAAFKGTEYCLFPRDMDGCARYCVHAKNHLADHSIRELQEKYCDNCIFASAEED